MDAEDIELELEALQFTYAEAVTILREHPLSVKIAVAPHTGADNGLSDLQCLSANHNCCKISAETHCKLPSCQVLQRSIADHTD